MTEPRTLQVRVSVEYAQFELDDHDPEVITPFSVLPDKRLWAAVIGRRLWIRSGGSDHLAEATLTASASPPELVDLEETQTGYLESKTGTVRLRTLMSGWAGEPLPLTAGPGWYCVWVTRSGSASVEDRIQRNYEAGADEPVIGAEQYRFQLWPADVTT